MINVPLANRTTIGVGGAASYLFEVRHRDQYVAAISFAHSHKLPIFVLGGGSNTCVGDKGFDGVVLSPQSDEFSVVEETEETVTVRIDAGHDWDAAVKRTVEEGWAGIECLSGIPGKVGAAPIQNIGAYGQEVSAVLQGVYAVDLLNSDFVHIPASSCDLSYRHSRFKTDWKDRYAIYAVEMTLSKRTPDAPKYPELISKLSESSAGLSEIRHAVLALRRKKSMVYDPSDPNHRSCGSFFLNPILPASEIEVLKERASQAGVPIEKAPIYPAPPSKAGHPRVKISAAWLMENAGFQRGYTLGKAALSSRHCLALINPGKARSSDIQSLVKQIQERVEAVYGIILEPEPVYLGTAGSAPWRS